MVKIDMNSETHSDKVIMIFVEGTILKPHSWFTLYNHNSYVPIGAAVEKIRLWEQQGASIVYCTSRKKKQAQDIANILKQYGFSGTYLVYREHKESYKRIVEELKPNILIEDDCKSIGGAWQMCITNVKDEIKANIQSIVVPEFKGIDHLPDDLSTLTDFVITLL